MVRVRYSFGCRHTGRIDNIKKQRGKYPDVMKDVLRISDIILEILDARFIEETRNIKIEEDVINQGKVLVYVINKSDLIDVKKIQKTIPKWMRPYVFVSATKKYGQKDLKSRIKIESKKILAKNKALNCEPKDLKKKKEKNEFVVKDLRGRKRVHVGVIGYPNSGKSSVINFLTRRSVAKTAKQAGFTRGMQKIRMDEDILILDTPGVIPESMYSTESKTFAQDVKVGARTYSDVKDPENVVFYLMKDYSEEIEKFYKIDAKGNVEKLIEELGLRMGHLGKGGIIDVDRTARIILRDWQEGKIKLD